MYKLWSDKEIKLLRKHYSLRRKQELVNILPNKTAAAISHKAQRLGLVKEARWWTEKELDILKNEWPMKAKPEILKALPKKLWTSIRHKAFKLGLKKVHHRTRYYHTYRECPKVTLTDRQIGYFAGVIDSDGHMRITRSRQKTGDYYTPFIGVTNTSMILIQKCMNIFKLGSFYAEKRSKPNHKTKLVYNTASTIGVKQILTQIVDELTVKKDRAKLILEFIKIKEEKTEYGTDPREIELYEEVRRLNRRGTGAKS